MVGKRLQEVGDRIFTDRQDQDIADLSCLEIEHALAHQLKDKSEAAYQRGTLFDKRRRLMDAWAEHCATQRTAGAVVSLRGAA